MQPPGLAFRQSPTGSWYTTPPIQGRCSCRWQTADKPVGLQAARIFSDLGYELAATAGTAAYLRRHGVEVAMDVAKLTDIEGAHAVDLIESGSVQLVINSPHGRGPRTDGAHIRSAANRMGLPLVTTGSAALAAADGLRDCKHHKPMPPQLAGIPSTGPAWQ